MSFDVASARNKRKTLRRRMSLAIFPVMTDVPPSAAAYGARLAQQLGLDRLALAYQGQVQPETGRIRATEALLRPSRGNEDLRPDLVVEDAERRGLGAALAYWTALQATEDARRLFPDRRGRVRLNLQEAQIADPAFIDRLQALWGPKGERNPGVDVEIVETARIGRDRMPDLEAGLRRLRESGAHLLLDDWVGSDEDHARLTRIRRFAPVTVKLDKSWFSSERPPERLAWEIEILRRAGVRLIAEGADKPTAAALKRQRLPRGAQMLVQGFEHHKPQALDLVVERLQDERQARQAAIAAGRAAAMAASKGDDA
jgi:EAL domain-containing protein (putative c-di-GMP-specific phosphodiesterase class I)